MNNKNMLLLAGIMCFLNAVGTMIIAVKNSCYAMGIFSIAFSILCGICISLRIIN